MYESHFGLSGGPFENTPNPKFFFSSQCHREALATLLYGIEQKKGFMLVTGEVGTGKTMLGRSLKERLPDDCILVEVTTPWITAKELFRLVAKDVNVTSDDDMSESVLLDKLRDKLLKLQDKGKKVVVLIDEAQQLPEHTLEAIRQLSNLESDTAKLIQIVLMGQTEMADLLARHSMRPLRQRIALNRELSSLSREDAISYIRHRLEVVGGSLNIFSQDALEMIYQYSRGVPRVLNLICDNALITAYASGQKQVQAETVTEVVADMPMALQASSSRAQHHQSNLSSAQPEVPRVAPAPFASERDAAPSRTVKSRDPRLVSEEEDPEASGPSDPQVSKPAEDTAVAISGKAAILGAVALVIIAVLATLLLLQNLAAKDSVAETKSAAKTEPVDKSQAAMLPSLQPQQFAPEPMQQPRYAAAPPQPQNYGADSSAQYLPAGQNQPASAAPMSVAPAQQAAASKGGIPFPFAGSQGEGASRQLQSGEAVTVIARREYQTWNDTIEDLLRAANPQLTSLDALRKGDSLWMPTVNKSRLLVQSADGSWYVYFGSFKNRRKAQDQADTFMRLGDPVEVQTFDGPYGTFFRIYLGAFTNRADAEDKAQSLWYRYMPLLN